MNNLLAQGDLQKIESSAFSGLVTGPALHVGTNLGDIVTKAIPWIFTIAGMLLLVYLIFGGLQLMLARGEPKETAAAKAHITNALTGFIIIFVAYWVTQLVGLVLNIGKINGVFR